MENINTTANKDTTADNAPLFTNVTEVAEPSVAKKIAKRTLIAGGVLALCGLGYFGYRALKKTKAVTVVVDAEPTTGPVVVEEPVA